MISSVRGRITFVATAVVALALLLASLLIVRMVESDLLATTERALAAELELEASFFDLDANTQFFEFDSNGDFYGLGVFLEDGGLAFGSIFDPITNEPIAEVVIDTDRAVVADIFDPFTGQTISNANLITSIEALAFDFRDLDGEDGNLLLVGAVARDEVDATMSAVRDALIVIVPVLAALMGLLIWWLVGRALRPVQAMSDRVNAITTTNLDQRVPVPKGNDEISGLATVMNSMLSRLERGDTRQRQFAADASHELRSPLAQREVQPGLSITGDTAQLQRAVENLVNNAHRHAAQAVLVSLRAVEHHGTMYAELCVEDDGDGVPVDQRHSIFERFRRLDEARTRDEGGAGLGLALVHAIVTRHGGAIAVDDSPTLSGARFTMHLPLAST